MADVRIDTFLRFPSSIMGERSHALDSLEEMEEVIKLRTDLEKTQTTRKNLQLQIDWIRAMEEIWKTSLPDAAKHLLLCLWQMKNVNLNVTIEEPPDTLGNIDLPDGTKTQGIIGTWSQQIELFSRAHVVSVDHAVFEKIRSNYESAAKKVEDPNQYFLDAHQRYTDVQRPHEVMAVCVPKVEGGGDFKMLGWLAYDQYLYDWRMFFGALKKVRSAKGPDVSGGSMPIYISLLWNYELGEVQKDETKMSLGIAYHVAAEVMEMIAANKSLEARFTIPNGHKATRQHHRVAAKVGRKLPEKYYELLLHSEVVQKGLKDLRARTHAWSYRTDRRAHTRMRILRGPQPLTDKYRRVLEKRKYTVYTASGPEIDKILYDRFQDPIGPEEWVATLAYGVRQCIVGPHDKPYIPHTLVLGEPA